MKSNNSRRKFLQQIGAASLLMPFSSLAASPDEQIENLIKKIKALEVQGNFCSGICTHLACGDESPKKFSHEQLRAFQFLVVRLESAYGKNFSWVHALNSPAILRLPTVPMRS